MIPLDVVRIGDTSRLCYGGTIVIAMVAPGKPVDMFETTLESEAARRGERVWELRIRKGTLAPGFANKGQAQRCVEMLAETKVEVVPLEEVKLWT